MIQNLELQVLMSKILCNQPPQFYCFVPSTALGSRERWREQRTRKERGEDREVEGKRGETHTEGGKEREKRKGEDREMEGRTPYTVMSKHILKGNEWVTHLLFMRI